MLFSLVFLCYGFLPTMMVWVVVAEGLKKLGAMALDRWPALAKRYDRIVAAGPKEGWSGYILLGVVTFSLVGFAVSAVLVTR